MKVLVAFAVLALAGLALGKAVTEERKSFKGYKVIRAIAHSLEEGEALLSLQRKHPSLDFWTEPALDDFTDIMASPEMTDEILDFLTMSGIEHEILIDDVGTVISNQQSGYQPPGTMEPISWTKYHTLDTVYEWFQNLTDDNAFVDVITIGQSTENRDVKVVRLSTNPSQNKPAIFIDSAIHAREWISLASILYMINELVYNIADNRLLNDVDFYFLPVINPDGYDFTHTTNRMWRKTRSVLNGNCYGVDANRNFGFEWDSCPGCSSGVCSSDTFRGPTPFSEPEADAMRQYIEDTRDAGVNWKSYISVHSYGQYFMLPWGYTAQPPVDYTELKTLADQVAGNITALYGTQYTTGSSSPVIYPTDGTSQDWAYGSGIFKYVYTAELRDKGAFGFLLPPAQIIPTAMETWAGFKVVARYLASQ